MKIKLRIKFHTADDCTQSSDLNNFRNSGKSLPEKKNNMYKVS